jgi:N-acetylornithine carbamoyltransferase
MNHLTGWHDLPSEVWNTVLDRALHHRTTRQWTKSAAGKSLGLLFFNPSLRTRTSMELAAVELGAHATTLVPGQGTWGFAWDDGPMVGNEAEHIEEAVGVLSRYYDALGVRLFASMTDYAADRAESRLDQFVRASSVPVVNMESAFWHPCQEMADAATIANHFQGDATNRRFVLSWAYHPRALPMAVPNSALMAAARSGMDVVLACPESHMLDEEVLAMAREASSDRLTVTHDLDAAVEGADIIYAKAWAGPLAYRDPEAEVAARQAMADWRITSERMTRTREAIFMHCLPVRRDVVVDADVLRSAAARHLLQAEYRLHAQKAILEYIWGLL